MWGARQESCRIQAKRTGGKGGKMEQRDPGEMGPQDLLMSQVCGVKEG